MVVGCGTGWGRYKLQVRWCTLLHNNDNDDVNVNRSSDADEIGAEREWQLDLLEDRRSSR